MANVPALPIDWIAIPKPDAGATGPASMPFAVSAYPVTVAQFGWFIANDGYRRRDWWSPAGVAWLERTRTSEPLYWGSPGYDAPQLPVTGVSFWEAEAFANSIGARLPNEDEWVWIASNGGSTRYPWGDRWPDDPRGVANLAFFGEISESRRVSVGSYPDGRSINGVWDLIGNVSEWCELCATRATGPARPAGGAPDGSTATPGEVLAVLKGGCCWHTPDAVDNSFRDEALRDTRDNQTGIRLVRGSRLTFSEGPASCDTGRSGVRSGAIAPGGAEVEIVSTSVSRPTRAFRQEGLPVGLTLQNWCLRVTGAVRKPLTLSLADLASGFPQVVRQRPLYCVCRWMDVNRIRGALLEDVVRAAEPARPLDQLFLLQVSVPGDSGRPYESTVPLGEAVRAGAILCHEMDGLPLTLELGWPIRLVHPSVYGYKQVKCLAELRLVDELRAGWWETEAGYDVAGKIRAGRFSRVRPDSGRPANPVQSAAAPSIPLTAPCPPQ